MTLKKKKETDLGVPENDLAFHTEVLEVMLYGCVTWTLSPGDFDKLREAHRGMLLRCLNAYTSTRAAPDYHMLSYLEVLLRTNCECIEATVMKRILHYAGRVARMHDGRLPTSSCEAKWSEGRENGASLRNASNTVSRNTALPSESTPSVGPPPVLSTCPLHTNSGCGKERRILIGPW